VEQDIGVHVHLQASVWIWYLDAHARGSCFGFQIGIDEGHLAFDGLGHVSADHDRGAHADLDGGQIRFGNVGNDPEVRQVGDAIELLARHDTLAVDDLLVDHGAGRRRRPIERAWVGALAADLLDSALGHGEVAQTLHGSVDGLDSEASSPALRSDCDREIDLGELDLLAVHPEQRFALAHELARRVDEQIFDVTFGTHGHHSETPLVVFHRADRAHRTHDCARLDRFGPHTAALDLVEAHFDGLAIVLLLALVD